MLFCRRRALITPRLESFRDSAARAVWVWQQTCNFCITKYGPHTNASQEKQTCTVSSPPCFFFSHPPSHRRPKACIPPFGRASGVGC